MSAIVAFREVSKRYRIGEGRGSLRDALTALPRRLLRRGPSAHDLDQQFWALRDVSFDLHPGQILGLVGRNGAGKTTTLKLLSGVTRPTSGQVDVDGRISALIELGAGFHPDLTGRENVFLNGVILGLTRKEISRKFDKIVEFAEMERFIDTPVKRYSSGMYARLGFAVAAHSEPDLLLVDEVLAVGDVAFQRKCYDFLHAFVKQGKTAVFVSHSMHVLEQLCNRLLWLEGGQVNMFDSPARVLPRYLDRIEEAMLADALKNAEDRGDAIRGPVRLQSARFVDDQGQARDVFHGGEDIVVEVPYETDTAIPRPHFNLGVIGPDGGGPLFTASMLVDGQAPTSIQGRGVMRCRFESLPLTPKVYTLWGEIWEADRSRRLADWQKLGLFRIVDPTSKPDGELVAGSIWHLRADAPIRVGYRWEYEQ